MYQDDQRDELYIAGQVINNAGSSQRITSLTPVVYGPQGNPVTSAADFEFLPIGLNYGRLLENVSLAPGHRLAFGFRVSLPEGITVEDNYEISVEAVPTEPVRNDIVTTLIERDRSGWPDFIHVECAVENPGSKLADYLVITVSVYDEDDRVIGLGWRYETAPRYLAPGTQIFDVKAVMLEIVGGLGTDMNTADVQAFGN